MRASAARTSVTHFEELYSRTPDPWGYATSDYERRKYEHTMEWVGPDPGRTLEAGCSIGVFSLMLALRVPSLLAVDFSETAVHETRRKLAGFDGAEAEVCDLPDETPRGPFDTIVCSEILYYWTPREVTRGLRAFEAALAPGGRFLAVHWRGSDPRRMLDGGSVHAQLREETILEPAGEDSTESYLLEAWEAPR